MADYIIQKAVNADAVKKKLQLSMEDYAQHFEAQHKYDGCCSVITLNPDGTTLCQSRTGEVYPSMHMVAVDLQAALYSLVRGTTGIVLIGEAWWPGKDQFSEISGEFRRMQPSKRLQFVINDVLWLGEFEAGHSDVPYNTRMMRLSDEKLPERASIATRYPPGSYGPPQALCNELVEMGGFDGLILRDPDGLWERGRGTTGEIVKIKRVLSFDLRVVGMEEGKGKHAGRMGAIQVDFVGKTLSVGTGFRDDEREDWWREQGGDFSVIGRIAEIEAMDYSSEGLLREPRFKGIRFDKTVPDIIAA